METFATVLALFKAVGRTAMSIAWERINRPRPTTLDEVPPSVDALTIEWLSLALCSEYPGAAVEHIDRGAKDHGTSARRPLTVTYNEAGQRAGLSEHLFTKSSPTFLTRLVTSTANLLPAEHAFYSSIRGRLDIEAPVARYAAWDARSNRSLFIMDDVTVTRNARVDTILTRRMTREQAEDMIDLLARLHATFWEDRSLKSTYPWLMDPVQWQERINRMMLMDRNAITGFDRAREVMPAEVYARKNDFMAALLRCREISSAGPRTLVHTDVHAGNWYVTGEGRMGLLDWQCLLHSVGMQDVTYALIANLPIEERRDWEHALVTRYRERLAVAGIVDVPTIDDLWLLHRQMVPHAMFMWLGTIGANKMQPDMQRPEISLANLERSTQACVDLDTFAALKI